MAAEDQAVRQNTNYNHLHDFYCNHTESLGFKIIINENGDSFISKFISIYNLKNGKMDYVRMSCS